MKNERVAQLAEFLILNQDVAGSIPVTFAILRR